MSWHATALYYRHLNELSEARHGPRGNAESVLVTLSFAPLFEAVVAGDEAAAIRRIADVARQVEAGGAGCVLLTAFTAHFAAEAVSQTVSIPLLHAGDALAAESRARGYGRVGLLGTGFTLRAGHVAARVEDAGVEVVLPPDDLAEEIDTIILGELTEGIVSESAGEALDRAVASLAERGADAVALACTELPLLSPRPTPVPLIDGVKAHVLYALDRMAQDGAGHAGGRS